MSVEQNKQVVRQMVERTGRGDSSAIDELSTENFVLHALHSNSGLGMDFDRSGYKKANDGGHAGFPDYSMTIDDMIAEDDKVFVLSTRSGTLTSKWGALNPTGKNMNEKRLALYRLDNGKVAEVWLTDEFLGQYQQLGVLPPNAEFIRAYNESHPA
jgi:predicted ester cyclase